MSKVLTCPRGHCWESTEQGPWPCPECGMQVVATEHHTPHTSEAATVARETPEASAADDRTVVREGDAFVAAPTDLAIHGYEILGELGRGGMGVVYQARDVELNRVVALKMVLAGEYSSAEELRRFQAEAEAEARMKHRHIVQIYDIGEHEGHPFVVLEFIAGGSLSQRLAEGPLPAREAAQLLQTVCEAVEHAHSHQVIHRDLKPANILLTSQGQPKVADFGLAKRLDEEFGHTQSGAILGTPSYMAPEQASGHKGEISPATDVYALGAILYECLTGKPPFQADTSLDTIMQVIADEPTPPRRLYRKVPRDLETIVLKCLHKAPQQRYATARELGDDLGRFLAGEPISARRASTGERMLRWLRRHPVSAALLLLVMVAMAGAAWWWGPTGYRWATNQGMLRVMPADGTEVDADTEVVLLQQGEEVGRFVWGKQQGLWLPAGEYQVDLAGANVGVEPEQEHVAITGGRQTVVLLRPEKAGELHQFTGHTSAVRALSVSPDGRYVLSGGGSPSSDRTLRLWDLHKGKQVWHVKPGPGACHAVQILPNSQRALSVHWEGKVLLWNLHNGENAHSYPDLKDDISKVTISPDGRRILTGHKDGMVRLWEAETGKVLAEYNEHLERVTAVALSPDGRFALSRGHKDNTAVLWDLHEKKRLHRFEYLGVLYDLAFHPDGKRFLTSGPRGRLCLRDLRTGWARQRYPGHSQPVLQVAFSADGKRLVSACADRTVRVWEVETGKELYSFNKHIGRVHVAAFVPTTRLRHAGRILVSAGGNRGEEDFAVRVWKIPHDANPFSPPTHAGLVRSFQGTLEGISGIAVSPDGRWAVSSSYREKELRLWDIQTGQERARLMGHEGETRSASFSSDGKHILSGGGKGHVILWDANTGKALLKHQAHQSKTSQRVWGTALSGDGKWALSCGSDQKVILWDLEKNEQVLSLLHPEKEVRLVALSSDKAWAVSSGAESTIQVWNLKTGKAAGQLKGHEGGIRDLQFVPGTSHVLSTSYDTTVRLWDVPSEQELFRFEGHWGGTFEVALSADGRHVYSGDGTGMVLVWDLHTGKQIAWCQAHEASISGLAVLPDGRFLTSTWKGEIRLWDPQGGKPFLPASADPPKPSPYLVRRLRGHLNGAKSVRFSPDGKHLLSSGARVRYRDRWYPGNEHSVRLWEVQTGKLVRPFTDYTKPIIRAVFQPGGLLFATCGSEQNVLLREVNSGQTRQTFTGHPGQVRALAFTSDGKRMVAGGSEGKAWVSDVETGKLLTTFTEPQKRIIRDLVWSPDNKTILCGCDDGVVHWIDAGTGKSLRDVKAHQDEVRRVVFLPDGQSAITGSLDGYVRQWDVKTGQQIPGKVLFQPTSVRCLALARGFARNNPRCHWAVTGGDDGTVRIWDLEKSEELFRFHGHQERVTDVDWSPDGKWIASSGHGKTLCLWRVPAPGERKPLAPSHDKGRLLIASPDPRLQVQIKQGEKVVVPATHQRLHTLKAGTYEVQLVGDPAPLRISPQRVQVGKPLDAAASPAETPLTEVRIWRGVPYGPQHRLRLSGHTANVRWLDISADGRQALSTSPDRTVRLWDLKTGQQVRRFEFNTYQHSVAFLPDGQRALSAGNDQWVHLWDVRTGKEIRCFRGHTNHIWGLAVSPDGKRALSCGRDKTIRVWDVDSGKEIHVFRDTHGVESADFSVDGKWIVSGGFSKILKLWDAQKGTLVREIAHTDEHIYTAFFTPRADQVVTGSAEGFVHIYDVKTGKLVRTMEGHQGSVICAAVSPDGTRIASASTDGTLRLWDLATGKEVHRFQGHANAVLYAVFTPDGKFLLAGGGTQQNKGWTQGVDFGVHVWEVPSKKAN